MQISPVGLKLIGDQEGFRAQAYQDVVGVWTIGYGTTSGAGVEVRPGMVCTPEQAQRWLADYVDRDIIPAIQAAHDARVKSLGWRTRFNQAQVDALCDAGYNLGPGVFLASSTLGADIRRGRTKRQVAADLALYVHAGGRVIPDLVARRATEQRLFLTGRL